MQKTQVPFLGREDTLEKEMATHSSILAWRIPCTEEPGMLREVADSILFHEESNATEQLTLMLTNFTIASLGGWRFSNLTTGETGS